MKNAIVNNSLYQRLYLYIASKRIDNLDADQKQIHIHLISTLTTGALMWAYALTAYFFMDIKVAGVVGLLCSIVHGATPFMYRYSNNSFFICHLMLVSGVIHQSTFAFYHGGFESFILIWFAVIPLLAGIISGRKGLVLELFIVTGVALFFLVVYLMGYRLENHLSQTGETIARSLILFGFIFLSSIMVYFYTILKDETESEYIEENKRTESLFRVLVHDFQNPLYIIRNYTKKVARFSEEPTFVKNINKIEKAQNVLIQISESMRRMHDVEKGKLELKKNRFSLLNSIQYVEFLMADSLRIKNIKLIYDLDILRDLNLYVDEQVFNNQVLANIISNAIKFSKEGTTIKIFSFDHLDYIDLVIQDRGIGIPSSLIDNIFDGGKEISRTGTLGEVGTGFGLAIAKSFMKRFEGEVLVESLTEKESLNHGTKITLRFHKINL